jgi:hypothetical protein
VGTLIRKTSLLRTVPTACGQAADKLTPFATFTSRPELGVARTNATFTSRPMLGAVLPLHDVRYLPDIGQALACLDRHRASSSGLAAERRSAIVISRTSKKLDQPAGGARRDRTDDLLLAKQALSQLSYGPYELWPSAMVSDQRSKLRIVKRSDARFATPDRNVPELGGPGKT